MTDLLAMAVFSMIMSITPGPVNLITLNSGLNHGFRRTFAYVSGATIGFSLLLLSLGLGLSGLIMAYPQLLHVLSILGTLYMVYLGYLIMKSSASDSTVKLDKVPKFLEGALLQCTNPKAWIACLSGITAFAKADSLIPLLSFVSIYFVICYLCISIWALAGAQLQLLLTTEKYRQRFSQLMGLLLIATAVWISVC